MTNYDHHKLETSLQDVQELENFLFALLPKLAQQNLKNGEDVKGYANELGVRFPTILQGETMTWDTGKTLSKEEQDTSVLVFTRPGNIEAIGLTIGCIKWRRYKICLECGWFSCRIVIKGVFVIG